jgi:hypothetical protein
MGISQAVRWALACCRTRVPEPIRLAEQVVNHLKAGWHLKAARHLKAGR